MRALAALVLLGLCGPALCLDRWFVQASYTGACPADRTQATNIKAQLAGCVPVPYSFDTPVWNYYDCFNNVLVSKLNCNDSTCANCDIVYNTTLLVGNTTDSQCTSSGGVAYVTECVLGEPSYPPNAPITKYFEALKCKGPAYSSVSGLAATKCTLGAKAYCSGSKVVAELWKDTNCSTSLKSKISTGAYCQPVQYDPTMPSAGSVIYYCAAHTLFAAPLMVLAAIASLVL